MGFAHLHVHTQYSLLDGAIRLGDLLDRCQTMGYDAVAITDHGNMYGAVRFFLDARKKGIKPIVGCEVYIAPGSRLVKEKGPGPYHLVLLCKDSEGYHNLCKLVSYGFLDGFYGKPRVDKDLLRQHAGGLFALSACMSGEVATRVKEGNLDAARETALEYRDIFGEGNFFLEIQKNGIVLQDRVNSALVEISKETGIPLVATNDCHYLDKGDHVAHEALLCIQTGKTMADKDRMTMDTDQLYFKSPQEMEEQFADYPEALTNAARIAEECNVHIETGVTLLPAFPAPEGLTTDQYLEQLAREGLARRIDVSLKRGDPVAKPEVYEERLAFEMGVISRMGFSDYYLIVWDFIRKAKEMKVSVGPGRGSGAGSLVAYAVGITELDPLRFDLLFERFLNPDRVGLPDFDIDFCQRKRNLVIDYVSQFYGKDRVGQIVTYSTLNSKTAIRDVGRVLGLPYGELDRISKLFPEGPAAAKMTIPLHIKENADIAKASQEPRYEELFRIASALEKLNRQIGVHAAGVVISRDPLMDVLPLATGKNGEVISQYAKEELEQVGLVKFDFLGLKTLTVIEDTLALIASNGKEVPDLEALPLDIPQVYELLSTGDTTGIFQMESGGFQSMIRKLVPDRFEDIIAALALYRPGPLGSGMADQYVRRKRGQEKVDYLHPMLEPVLWDTYGVIIYQEQVMRIAVEIAGFTLSKADELRKAMGKKNEKKMAELSQQFVEGAIARGHADPFVRDLIAKLVEFGHYGFNKSHSAAYALISYWTGYLKAFYPVEFVTALMCSDKDKPDKMVNYLAECRRMKIHVGCPDINLSQLDFAPRGDRIVFGLSGIRNVGESAAVALLKEREKKGPYTDFQDFCLRLDSRKVNKRVVEWLIHAGAFDCFRCSRGKMLQDLDQTLALAQSEHKHRAMGQKSLFGLAGGTTPAAQIMREAPPETEACGQDETGTSLMDKETLYLEKEAVGFFVTSHPMDRYLSLLPRLCTHSTATIQEADADSRILIAGCVSALEERLTKKAKAKWGRFNLEDRLGMQAAVAFPDTYELASEPLHGRDPIVVDGHLQIEEEGEVTSRTIMVRQVWPLAEAVREWTQSLRLEVSSQSCTEAWVDRLRQLVQSHPGTCPLTLWIRYPGRGTVRCSLPADTFVTLTEDLLAELVSLGGNEGIHAEIRVPEAPPPSDRASFGGRRRRGNGRES
jgi:DNA polymerase-3 subunit alpha